jgi:hypothetical protein
MKLQLDRCSVHAGLDAQINNYYQETAKMQREQRHMHVLSHITCPPRNMGRCASENACLTCRGP